MATLAAGLFPHPPIMIPEIGGNELEKMRLTVDTEEKAMSLMAAAGAETVVVISPHNLCFYDGPAIFIDDAIEGDLAAFGHPGVSMSLSMDRMLSEAIVREAAPLMRLHRVDRAEAAKYHKSLRVDWGTFVPMYYLLKAGFHGRVVLLSPCFSHYETNKVLGAIVDSAAAKLKRKIIVIASGDLSHKMAPNSPNGYTKNGIVFDNAVMDALKRRDMAPLTAMSAEFIEEIAMCGLPSVYFLFGVLGNRPADLTALSHEGPFGVGYGIACYRLKEGGGQAAPHDPRVKLAKESIAYYLRTGRFLHVPADVPEDMKDKAAVFVSLHEFGALRGCIGTIRPAYHSMAEEIIHNAKAAATEDPRFPGVSPYELDDLEISVDVLSAPEPATKADLDPKRYGVIVEAGPRRGLLLPDLEGVDTVEEQVRIAKQKAGIAEGEPVRLYRFTVKRYY